MSVNRTLVAAGAAALLAGVTGAGSTAAAGITRPDTFLARVEALASTETLNAEVLGSRSATRTLEKWCALHRMAAEPRLVAIRVRGDTKPISAEGRERLGIGADEPVRYRHVKLTCGDHLLSDADNWYVPSRLTAEMNQALETTDIPFGRVIAPLRPTRLTFAAELLWPVLPPGWQEQPPPPDHPERALAIPPVLFEHHAVVIDGERRPIAEVDERYTRDVLAFPGRQ